MFSSLAIQSKVIENIVAMKIKPKQTKQTKTDLQLRFSLYTRVVYIKYKHTLHIHFEMPPSHDTVMSQMI